jgi:hypothetical protein
MQPFNIRDVLRAARTAGIGSDQIKELFELTAEELEQIESGDVTAWEAMVDTAYGDRVAARLNATVTGAERQEARAFGAAISSGLLAADEAEASARSANAGV